MRSVQCQKSLYLHKHHPDLKDEISESQEAVFTTGTNVGLLARELFPDGVDVSPPTPFDYGQSVKKTEIYIKSGMKVIYEACFQFEGVLCATDILVKDGKGYKAYEVKSSTEIKPQYKVDASLQCRVITNSGIKLSDISIVYINSEYVRKGKLDLKKLFNIESVMVQSKENQEFIREQIISAKATLKQKTVPAIDIGPHCSDPYECDFAGHCWKHIPEYSVFNIANLRSTKKFAFYDEGILELSAIPEDAPLNEKQWQQIHSELNRETIINKPKIQEFVQSLKYPLSFLDFETFQLAIPPYDNCRPYQQLVFQYSLHKQNKTGKIEHFEFLAKGDVDPRIDFIKKLIDDCGTVGDILVYNIGFERGKLNQLAIDFPKYQKQIGKIVERLKDLMIPFQQRLYYTPAMRGSYSIKNVLPALVPFLSYEGMEIANGGDASNTFASIVEKSFVGDIEKTRTALLKYCEMDTWAMVRILQVLKEV